MFTKLWRCGMDKNTYDNLIIKSLPLINDKRQIAQAVLRCLKAENQSLDNVLNESGLSIGEYVAIL